MDDQLQKLTKEIQSDELISVIDAKKNIVLIGLPKSGRTELLQGTFEKTKQKEFVNCILISHTKKWEEILKKLGSKKYQLVILENFEYEIKNHDANIKKLRLLEQLINSDTRVIISTEVHPMEIPTIYYDELEKSSDTQKETSRENMEDWRRIFSNFIDIYKPLKDNLNDNYAPGDEFSEDILVQELRFGSYMEDIKEHLKSYMVKSEEMKSEAIISEIQAFANSYYYSIWNTLSKEERYLVYDLAKDTFVNIKNMQVIVSLLKKGLFNKGDGGINILNKSFTNFVLDTVNADEALEMEKEEKAKGKWATVSTVLVMVIVSLVVLIAFGEPNFSSNVNSILIAVAGVASLIPAISSFFLFSQKLKS